MEETLSELSPRDLAERIQSAIASGRARKANRLLQSGTGKSLWSSREALKCLIAGSTGTEVKESAEIHRCLLAQLSEPWDPIEAGPRLPEELTHRLKSLMRGYYLGLGCHGLAVVALWLFSESALLFAVAGLAFAGAAVFAFTIPFGLRFEFASHRVEDIPVSIFVNRFKEWIRQMAILGIGFPVVLLLAVVITEAVKGFLPGPLAGGFEKVAIIGFIYFTFQGLSALHKRGLIGPY